jgi:hypothetical protein
MPAGPRTWADLINASGSAPNTPKLREIRTSHLMHSDRPNGTPSTSVPESAFDAASAQDVENTDEDENTDVSDEILSPTFGYDLSSWPADRRGPADGPPQTVEREAVELPTTVIERTTTEQMKSAQPSEGRSPDPQQDSSWQGLLDVVADKETESELAEMQSADLLGKAVRLQSLEKQVSDARKEICELEKKIASLQQEAKELSSTIETDEASGFRWEFEKSNSEWSEFPGAVAASLTSAYAKFEYGGPSKLLCNTWPDEFSFDFAEMKLTNVKTGEVQSIQCKLDVHTLCYRAIRRRSKGLADQSSKQAYLEDQSITETLRPNNTKFKTERCKFHLQGKCRYGIKCSYAHNEEELRTHLDNKPDTISTSCIGCN